MSDMYSSQHKLGDIVQNAQCDSISYKMIRRHVNGILTHLGMKHNEVNEWLEKNVKNIKIENLENFETLLHDSLSSFGIYQNLDVRMEERAVEWFSCIKPYLIKGTVLDLGGGSGELANLIKKFGCKVSIADVINWSKYDIPFVKVKENVIDARDKQFDQVVLLTVYHHTDGVAKLVNESFRVAKKRVTFIESVTENDTGYMYGAWIDWFYNRVIHYSEDPKKKINVPCNFLPTTGWEQLIWKLTSLKPKVSINLGIFQFLNPENHHLFVYDK